MVDTMSRGFFARVTGSSATAGFQTANVIGNHRVKRRTARGLLSASFLISLAFATAANALPTFNKSFTPSTIGPGSISTLQFNISNPDPVGVRNLAFTDNLPAGMTIASPANLDTSCFGLITAPEGGTTISYADGGIGPSASCSISVDVTSGSVGTHSNVSGNLTSDAGTSGSASADLTVAADRPGFSKSFSPASVFFGGRSTLTFTIDNTANSAAAANLTFVDNLPSGMEVAGPSNASTTCGGGVLTAAPGGNVVRYTFQFFGDATVAAGASCSVSVDVLGNRVGRLGNTTGELTSTPQTGFPTRSSGKAGATLNVNFEQIVLNKSFTDDPVAPGDTVNLEFTVRNLDRRSSASNIAFTDDLDAALAGLAVSGSLPADPCGPGSSLSGTGVLSLSGGNLAPEASCTFSVSLLVPSAAASGEYLNTTSQISADVGGSPVVGDPATDLLFVRPAPVLTKTFLSNPVGAGDSVVLEFTITNTSPTSSATDIAFDDVFSTILPTASSVPANDFCGSGSTASFFPLINPTGSTIPAQLVIAGASLPPGGSCTFSITLDVAVDAATGTYPNTTSAISATIDGATLTGNPAVDELNIVAAPALIKEFIDDPAAPGGTVTLRFTLIHDGENGAGAATDITFTDDLDATLSGLTATGLPLADVCGVGSEIAGSATLTLTGGTLAAGASCTFDVSLQVPSTAPAGAHTNITSAVVATVQGVTATANPAQDDLNIAGLNITKEFTDDPAFPGGSVNLQFTIENISPISAATDILFTDNLSAALSNLSATGLPLNDVCGTGSSLTGVSGDTLLIFQGGSLAPGESCTFGVTLQVPAGASAGVYANATSGFSATIDGTTVFFSNASDGLIITSDLLGLTKEFTDDPVGPGDIVNLRFTIANLETALAADNIAFSDDLGAALPGLVSVSGTLVDVCGVGSLLSGTDVLSFSAGSLPAASTCSFDVSLMVPSSVPLGTVVTNTTSAVTGTIDGVGVTGDPASDDLRIDFLTFSKAFDAAADPGGTVTLSFAIQNLSATDSVDRLSFTDDLGAVLSGLVASGLPAADVCGVGSELVGTSTLALNGGNLLPGGSCTFSVTLSVPGSAAPGSYVNTTSELLQFGLPVAAPASATLTVLEADPDTDNDGVPNEADACPDTVIPESVPTQALGTNRYALVDNDFIFDTVAPNGNGSGDVFTTTDTAGCSCEQIIDGLGLGGGHVKFGCSVGAMRSWVDLVNP